MIRAAESRHRTPSHERTRARRTARCEAHRQVPAARRPRLHVGQPGAGAPADPAAAARRGGGPEHRGLRVGLSRLAARPLRHGNVAGAGVARRKPHPLSRRRERGSRGHRAVGQPVRRQLSGCEVRRRVRHLVRQGPGRRPLRRRPAAREQRGHQPVGRRARDRRRRSRRQVVDDHQFLRSDLHRRRDSGALPVERAGAPRLRPARHRDEPLFRLLGRAEGGHRYRRRRRHDRGRPRPSADRRAGARAGSGAGPAGWNIRRVDHAARAGRASLPSQASCGTRVHPRQPPEPDHP